ncbi:uncharacterized protein LOC127243555 [Andrographis paniculata]|uniref:uncharacterized protein LOC127243555 n=1 Tax=Andrographis paniculata TaxID=175694 RepID=UPI0021E70FDC|nr:uncharacterized protein LOC127243555 [Andrographis paniculata]
MVTSLITTIRTIKSEDGDIIDCVDMFKQPAFDHPALKGHKIQLNPSEEMHEERSQDPAATIPAQIWRRRGSCPKGTIPIRRMKKINTPSKARTETKVWKFDKSLNESKELYLMQKNHSVAILHTEGYAYFGAKGDIKVWNPKVEWDDEYSTSRVALTNHYQMVQSGWAVSLLVIILSSTIIIYIYIQTRVFVYWTADDSNQTGCFDLTCPGFIQTSNEIALGAALYPVSSPTGLPSQITIYIHKDLTTSNWWVQYGEKTNIGYFPAELMDMLKHNAEVAQWGGEVYSSRVGGAGGVPHTATAMGSGRFADFIFATSGCVKRMRELRGNGELVRPEWVNAYSDES